MGAGDGRIPRVEQVGLQGDQGNQGQLGEVLLRMAEAEHHLAAVADAFQDGDQVLAEGLRITDRGNGQAAGRRHRGKQRIGVHPHVSRVLETVALVAEVVVHLVAKRSAVGQSSEKRLQPREHLAVRNVRHQLLSALGLGHGLQTKRGGHHLALGESQRGARQRRQANFGEGVVRSAPVEVAAAGLTAQIGEVGKRRIELEDGPSVVLFHRGAIVGRIEPDTGAGLVLRPRLRNQLVALNPPTCHDAVASRVDSLLPGSSRPRV